CALPISGSRSGGVRSACGGKNRQQRRAERVPVFAPDRFDCRERSIPTAAGSARRRSRAEMKQLSRRTILRGIGASISLPLLDAMFPAFGATAAPPVRMMYVYAPTGMMPNAWYPDTTGPDFEF